MKYAFALALLTGLVIVTGVGRAEACDCGAVAPPPAGFPVPPPPTEPALEKQVERARDAAVAVFIGKAVKLDQLTVTFEIEKNWKGAAEKTLSMSNGYEQRGAAVWISSCAFWFKEGETYLVFAYGKSRADMRADGVCSTFTTGELPDRADTVRRLDILATRVKLAVTNRIRTNDPLPARIPAGAARPSGRGLEVERMMG